MSEVRVGSNLGMRAAVIGTNWGEVHIRALQAHDVDVIAVCGLPTDEERTAGVAARYGVKVASSDPRQLLAMSLDLVTIATPAETHPALLQLFAGLPVICEKPLLGMTGDPELVPSNPAVWVNYAFSFLDSARVVAQTIPQLGEVREVRIDSSYDMDLTFTAPEWFLEVASHPLSFAVDLFGTPRLLSGEHVAAPDDMCVLHLRVGETLTKASCRRLPGLDGIEHRLVLTFDGALLELAGSFRGSERWRYGPVLLDGQPISEVEEAAEDCWMRANVRSIGSALRAIAAGPRGVQAAEAGLFSLEQAQAIDDCVREAFP